MRDGGQRQLVINGNLQLFREFLTAVDIERGLEQQDFILTPHHTAVPTHTNVPPTHTAVSQSQGVQYDPD